MTDVLEAPVQIDLEGNETPLTAPEDVAPRKRGPGRPSKKSPDDKPPRARTRPVGAPSRKKQLEEFLSTAAMSISVYGMTRGNDRIIADGQIIMAGAERWCDAMDQLAKKNASVARMIDGMLTGTTYTAVIVSTLAILIPIMANHELLPAVVGGMMGGEPMPGAPTDAEVIPDDPGAPAAA